MCFILSLVYSVLHRFPFCFFAYTRFIQFVIVYQFVLFPMFSELIREVSRDGERVTEILKSLSSDVLERDVLNKCLISAVKNDNSVNIGKLVIKGAKDIQFCLEAATKEKKLKARAMLLLIIAASTGDTTIIQHLYGETVEDINHCKDWFLDDDFKEVQKIVQTGTVSTVVAIEMARRCGNSHVREALILKTDVREKEGTVSWHGLRLLRLEDSWLEKITWVKSLRLHRNGLKVLPENIGHYLRQVCSELEYLLFFSSKCMSL